MITENKGFLAKINADIERKYKSSKGNLRATFVGGNTVYLRYFDKPKFNLAFVAKTILERYPSVYWVHIQGDGSFVNHVYSKYTLSYEGYMK